ncbi:hypothetical protein [Planctopirus limnophila]|nr:hypothetical protein [Planctopirus limnophila]
MLTRIVSDSPYLHQGMDRFVKDNLIIFLHLMVFRLTTVCQSWGVDA